MGRLEEELEDMVGFVGNGGGFGAPEALEEHNRKIEHLKFRITRRDNFKIAVMSAIIGAVVGSLVPLIGQLF